MVDMLIHKLNLAERLKDGADVIGIEAESQIADEQAVIRNRGVLVGIDIEAMRYIETCTERREVLLEVNRSSFSRLLLLPFTGLHPVGQCWASSLRRCGYSQSNSLFHLTSTVTLRFGNLDSDRDTHDDST